MIAACTKQPAHNERETDEITFQVSVPVTKGMFSKDEYFQKEGNRIKIYDFNPGGKYFDDYYYFRRYHSGCTLKEKFYGDVPYDGR